ncbi:MAG: hypothetical protein RSB76_03065 [Clostridia bacterium]
MDNLNQLEIQNIRHICGHCTNFCNKITYYKTLTTDSNVSNVLDELVTKCNNLKTQVNNML